MRRRSSMVISGIGCSLSGGPYSGGSYVPERGKPLQYAGDATIGGTLGELPERIERHVLHALRLDVTANPLPCRHVIGVEPGVAQFLRPFAGGPSRITGLAIAAHGDMRRRVQPVAA